MANEEDIPADSGGGSGAHEPDCLDADPRQAKVFAKLLSEMNGSWVWLSHSEGEIGDQSVGSSRRY